MERKIVSYKGDFNKLFFKKVSKDTKKGNTNCRENEKGISN